ncbi:hypothetical protein OOJ91_12505 [Micromonospora lupini]|uniref:hypothetical protein n=1 Tax=Micromonospora lupini TaxID=285679 RepID=UPI00224E396B|nr:hypothetical protein [Micromonospora lupini]MCX5066701.1 hypothetical protein [Micromonospora lupini]
MTAVAAKTRATRTVGPNPAYVRTDQERRRSGAAGPQDSRPRRQRTRAAARNAAIRDHQ